MLHMPFPNRWQHGNSHIFEWCWICCLYNHTHSQAAPKLLTFSVCQQLQAKLYLSIIDDVIESMRELFLDEGLEDRVLDDLKHVSYIVLLHLKNNTCNAQVRPSSEDIRCFFLLCSFGSQRWCSQKQWKTSGKIISTRPTLYCSSPPTTVGSIRHSQVTQICLKWTASCLGGIFVWASALDTFDFFLLSASVVIPASQNFHSFPMKASSIKMCSSSSPWPRMALYWIN